jgi:hypothetical protein
MFTGDPMVTTSSPEYIFITVDPSGGGMSQLAICSGYYTLSGEFVVIHFKKNPKPSEERARVGGFFEMNFQSPPFLPRLVSLCLVLKICFFYF